MVVLRRRQQAGAKMEKERLMQNKDKNKERLGRDTKPQQTENTPQAQKQEKEDANYKRLKTHTKSSRLDTTISQLEK